MDIVRVNGRTSSSPLASSDDGRCVVVEGACNVRDLGGLATTTGQMLRRRRIFRSDYPGLAVLGEGALVRRLGLRTVVDLRRGAEASCECVDWAEHGVRYHRWPLTSSDADAWQARYSSYLEHRPETVVAAVDQIARSAGHPVLFHCAAGKDRTGVVAALLLSVLGVAREQIVSDYMLSAPSVTAVLDRLASIPPYDSMLADVSPDSQQPRPEYMEQLLDWLDAQGGAETWLKDRGLGADVVDGFRECMTLTS